MTFFDRTVVSDHLYKVYFFYDIPRLLRFHKPRHQADARGSRRFHEGGVFGGDAAYGVDGDMDGLTYFSEEFRSSWGETFFAVGGEDVPCGDVGGSRLLR